MCPHIEIIIVITITTFKAFLCGVLISFLLDLTFSAKVRLGQVEKSLNSIHQVFNKQPH